MEGEPAASHTIHGGLATFHAGEKPVAAKVLINFLQPTKRKRKIRLGTSAKRKAEDMTTSSCGGAAGVV